MSACVGIFVLLGIEETVIEEKRNEQLVKKKMVVCRVQFGSCLAVLNQTLWVSGFNGNEMGFS